MPAFRRLRQEDLQFKVSLGYLARPCLKRKKKKTTMKTDLLTDLFFVALKGKL
jgi:hypothetical protein